MALNNPVYVTLFDKDDEIIVPVTRAISVTYNLEAHDFNYVGVQVETYDEVMRKVLSRWGEGELIQYKIEGRFGTDTGDLNSIYAYDQQGSGEFSFYGRSHKEIIKNLVGFPDPSTNVVKSYEDPNTASRQYGKGYKTYTGKAGQVMFDVIKDNLQTRLGVAIVSSGSLAVGNDVTIKFRFDEIHKHFYADTKDKGGALLEENGNVIYDITRDFAKHRYVFTAREPAVLEQSIEVASGLIERWQFTSDRGEVDRAIVGGPGEAKKRMELEKTRKVIQHRRFPAESFVENTTPDIDEEDKAPYMPDKPTEDNPGPTLAEQKKERAAQLVAMLEYAEGKLEEHDRKSAITGQILESDHFYLGKSFHLGDYVKIGVDKGLPLGAQQIEKVIVTWTVADGYKVQLTKPNEAESSEMEVLKKVVAAVKELATRDRGK